jgi:hypothetical protein
MLGYPRLGRRGLSKLDIGAPRQHGRAVRLLCELEVWARFPLPVLSGGFRISLALGRPPGVQTRWMVVWEVSTALTLSRSSRSVKGLSSRVTPGSSRPWEARKGWA